MAKPPISAFSPSPLLGRVIPIDPVLAVLGDRAPNHVVERTREAMGLNCRLPASSSSTARSKHSRGTSGLGADHQSGHGGYPPRLSGHMELATSEP
ncbi:hypothetical protein F2981_00910 [Sinorhizobium meliloti]|nr:hypothetical protein [Sinorhizobium meliloti]